MLLQRPLASTPAMPMCSTSNRTIVATKTAAVVTHVENAALDQPPVSDVSDAVVSLDQLGPQTMTVSAVGATDTCPNAHIGALFPADLEHITFRGPIDIHSIETLDKVPVLVPGVVAPSSNVVQVTERIGQGAIWNAFATTATTPAAVPSVLKVTCVTAYESDVEGDWEVEEIRKHIVKEILAHRTLRNVRCVPSLLSVWAGVDKMGREYWATMEEDAGRPVEVEDMTDAQKQAVLDAYAAIHEQGVMHCDVKSIHWRFTDNSLNVRLIDFSHAVDLSALGAQHSRVMCLSEIGDVRDALEAHSEGWTKEPYSLVPSKENSPVQTPSP